MAADTEMEVVRGSAAAEKVRVAAVTVEDGAVVMRGVAALGAPKVSRWCSTR